jgi:carbamoyltransferase
MFRPFAPIVPARWQSRYFDLAVPSPYMLINARVHGDVISSIPAVVHADGTARVQAIDPSVQPDLHALLEAVGVEVGVPILLNTSLNLAGEPIVESPADAVDLFARSRLDALVLGHLLLTKAPLSQLLAHPNPGPDAMPA